MLLEVFCTYCLPGASPQLCVMGSMIRPLYRGKRRHEQVSMPKGTAVSTRAGACLTGAALRLRLRCCSWWPGSTQSPLPFLLNKRRVDLCERLNGPMCPWARLGTALGLCFFIHRKGTIITRPDLWSM